jgi:hypothetical protein
MSAMVGPDGKVPTFNGGAWVSANGRYWWNGAAWQPTKKRGWRPPIAVPLIVLVVLVGTWYVLTHVQSKTPHEPYGVTNARIDSSSEFEFDYRRSTSCKDLTFDYTFLDKAARQVGIFTDEQHSQVDADRTSHFDVFVFTPISAKAVRFNAVPTCHA